VETFDFGRAAVGFRESELLWRCRLLGMWQWFIDHLFSETIL